MSKIYVAAESGEPKRALDAWREEYYRCKKLWHEFAEEIGAERLFAAPFQPPSSFSFARGKQPEGWVQPVKGGRTWPYKKNKEMCDKIAALPAPKHIDTLCEELGLPTSISYDRGGFRIGRGWNTYTAQWWREGPVVIGGEDFRNKLDNVTGGKFNVGDGTIPDGFVLMTEVEVDFKFAESKLNQEKQNDV